MAQARRGAVIRDASRSFPASTGGSGLGTCGDGSLFLWPDSSHDPIAITPVYCNLANWVYYDADMPREAESVRLHSHPRARDGMVLATISQEKQVLGRDCNLSPGLGKQEVM